jgi:pilus assembly protein CpaB
VGLFASKIPARFEIAMASDNVPPMKNYILLGVSVICGLCAFFLAKSQLQKKYRQLELHARKVPVVAVRNSMVAGDVLQRGDVGFKRVYEINLTGHEVISGEEGDIIGQRLANDVKKLAVITWRDIVIPGGRRGGGLAERVEKKQRAISISVDNTSAVSGLVRPNDKVDIVGTFRFPVEQATVSMDVVTWTLLQDVTVLATGQSMSRGGEEARQRGYSTLTLALSPEEAELIIFAEQKGKLTLTLRNPADVYTIRARSINFADLEKKLDDLNSQRQGAGAR